MLSYWEQKYCTHYDNVIVGAGLAGLFSALNLKKKFPEQSVLVIEKEMFPVASTKNAGFACMGSLTELVDDLQTSNIVEIVELFEKRYQGLQIMRDELGDENIGYQENGSYELLNKKNEIIIDNMEAWNERLFSVANKNAFSLVKNRVDEFKGFSNGIKNELEGEINTGLMWQSLLKKVLSSGMEVIRNSSLISYEKMNGGYCLKFNGDVSLQTKRLIFCTNAFTKELLPDINIEPARAQVLITKPIKNLSFKGIYHFDRGYYYFREIDGRVLFGGGRQLDKEGESTNALGENQIILDDLKTKLQENILPNIDFEIDYSWSGIMGFSNSKKPICRELDTNLYILASFGGMGVALAPYMAKQLVRQIN